MSRNGQDMTTLRRREVIRIGMMAEERDTGDPVLEAKLGEPEIEEENTTEPETDGLSFSGLFNTPKNNGA